MTSYLKHHIVPSSIC